MTPTNEQIVLHVLAEQARLVSQWAGAIGSGPVEVLDRELEELGFFAKVALDLLEYQEAEAGAIFSFFGSTAVQSAVQDPLPMGEDAA